MIGTEDGGLRFVDAPEVARTAERGVTLTIEPDQVAALPPPESGAGTLPRQRPAPAGSARLFGRGWKRD